MYRYILLFFLVPLPIVIIDTENKIRCLTFTMSMERLMNFRTVILALLLALVPGLIYGQNKAGLPNLVKFDLAKKHFGFYLGANQMFFTIQPADGFQRIYTKAEVPDMLTDSVLLQGVTSKPIPGFSIGLVSNLRLGNYFDLRFLPGLQFGERQVSYHMINYTNGDSLDVTVDKNISSTYIDFPLYLRYKSARVHNFRASVYVGGNFKIDLASRKDDIDQSENVVVKLKSSDYAMDAGVIFDFYTVYFKFGVELRMTYGFGNILVKDQTLYTTSIDKMKSKMFQVSFTFE